MFKKLWPFLLGSISVLTGTWLSIAEKQKINEHLQQIEMRLKHMEEFIKDKGDNICR